MPAALEGILAERLALIGFEIKGSSVDAVYVTWAEPPNSAATRPQRCEDTQNGGAARRAALNE